MMNDEVRIKNFFSSSIIVPTSSFKNFPATSVKANIQGVRLSAEVAVFSGVTGNSM
jgi:hypothetical protein